MPLGVDLAAELLLLFAPREQALLGPWEPARERHGKFWLLQLHFVGETSLDDTIHSKISCL
jgi:hypothetical protein